MNLQIIWRKLLTRSWYCLGARTVVCFAVLLVSQLLCASDSNPNSNPTAQESFVSINRQLRNDELPEFYQELLALVSDLSVHPISRQCGELRLSQEIAQSETILLQLLSVDSSDSDNSKLSVDSKLSAVSLLAKYGQTPATGQFLLNVSGQPELIGLDASSIVSSLLELSLVEWLVRQQGDELIFALLLALEKQPLLADPALSPAVRYILTKADYNSQARFVSLVTRVYVKKLRESGAHLSGELSQKLLENLDIAVTRVSFLQGLGLSQDAQIGEKLLNYLPRLTDAEEILTLCETLVCLQPENVNAIQLQALLRDLPAIVDNPRKYQAVEIAALTALYAVGDESILPQLLERATNSRTEQSRIAAIKALGINNDPRAVRPLMNILLSSQPVRVRLAAAESLRQLPLPVPDENFFNTLQDPDGRIRAVCGQLAFNMKIQGVGYELTNSLSDQQLNRRDLIAITLGELNYNNAVPQLTTLALGKDLNLAAAAVKTLQRLTSPAAKAALQQIANQNPAWEIRYLVAQP